MRLGSHCGSVPLGVTDGEEIRELVGYVPEHDSLPTDRSATEFVSHMARVSGLPSSAPATSLR